MLTRLTCCVCLCVCTIEKTRVRKATTALLTKFTVSHGDLTLQTWRDLLPQLWTTYRDGYVFSGFDQSTVSVQRMFYPEWWLSAVGYFNPMNLNHDNGAILFASNPAVNAGELTDTGSDSSGAEAGSGSSLLVLALLGGLAAGRVQGRKEGRREGYASIASTP